MLWSGGGGGGRSVGLSAVMWDGVCGCFIRTSIEMPEREAGDGVRVNEWRGRRHGRGRGIVMDGVMRCCGGCERDGSTPVCDVRGHGAVCVCRVGRDWKMREGPVKHVVQVWYDITLHYMTLHGKTGQVSTRLNKTRQDKERQDIVGHNDQQDETRWDGMEQDKTGVFCSIMRAIE